MTKTMTMMMMMTINPNTATTISEHKLRFIQYCIPKSGKNHFHWILKWHGIKRQKKNLIKIHHHQNVGWMDGRLVVGWHPDRHHYHTYMCVLSAIQPATKQRITFRKTVKYLAVTFTIPFAVCVLFSLFEGRQWHVSKWSALLTPKTNERNEINKPILYRVQICIGGIQTLTFTHALTFSQGHT